jgi:hypothetical protein
MQINNPLPPDRMYDDDGHLVRCKKLDIGSWNMDTTASKSVNHGLGAFWTNVIGIQIFVFHDNLGYRYPLSMFNDAADPSLIGGGLGDINAGSLTLRRRAGGLFDNASFDDAGINRGNIFIWYFE